MKMFDAIMRATDGVADRLQRFRHTDAWYNGVTGFGTTRDKTTYGTAVAGETLSLEELGALYNHNDMAARMVDVFPDEVYREGFEIQTEDAELDAIIAEKFDGLGVVDRFADGMRWGRAFGAGAVLIGADDGRPADKPLVIERANDIRYLYDFDRRWLTPHTYYTEFGHPKFGQPDTYLVWNQTSFGGSQIVVHESRLILFGGATTGRQERLLNLGWDMSILQRAHDVLRQFDTGWKSVEILFTDAHQTVMRMADLTQIIGTPGGQEALQRRATIMDMYRSVMRAIVVDAGTKDEPAESMERLAVSFESIPQTLDKLIIRLAATSSAPVTVLMGQSPSGMNATGESDLRLFFGRCDSERTRKQGPKVRRLTSLWLQTKAGRAAAGKKLPDTLTVKWPSLWSETPLNEATRRKTIAEADAIQITAQMYTPEEVALVRGRPEGWDKDVVLTDEAIKARETALQADLEDLGKPREEPSDETETAPPSTETDPTQPDATGEEPAAAPSG